MELYIKNMVCPRCKMAVETILKEEDLQYIKVELGEVLLKNEAAGWQLERLKRKLEAVGFELLDDHRKMLIDKAKNLLIELVQQGNIDEHFALSAYISKNIHKEYSTVSKLFTQLESITLEQYFILQKIEKVKEWLVYDEFSLSEISYKLGYSSVGYLSNQFKRITGLTPSAFKANHKGVRKTLDNVNENK